MAAALSGEANRRVLESKRIGRCGVNSWPSAASHRQNGRRLAARTYGSVVRQIAKLDAVHLVSLPTTGWLLDKVRLGFCGHSVRSERRNREVQNRADRRTVRYSRS